ncbi:MAG: bifunctional folylpolyglutamate synthase/dihydrofolate synthase [Ignavibacteriae bacterium]|nr:bifunctional folylpolyglutamate synthase/dihydrofolate synthase [Ignavibacteriota bacterium]
MKQKTGNGKQETEARKLKTQNPKPETTNSTTPILRYSNPLEFLYSLQQFGIKLGLRNIQLLCEFLGNPERKFPSVHIAGTNGKGSTSAMLAAILTASGYRTGLYTSPHLVEFNERIRIDGKKISDEQIADYCKYLKPKIIETKSTFFESTTAIAFKYFADEKVDIAIIETGLGGRFDATNVVTPLLSIITNIGLDHTEHLGKTLAEIALEKAGIIKRNIPCMFEANERETRTVIRNVAKNNYSRVIEPQRSGLLSVAENSLEGLTVNLWTTKRNYRSLRTSLPGNHQQLNLRLAVHGAEHLKHECGFDNITIKSMKHGLKNIQSLAGLHARLEVISNEPLIVADVAHNPEGINAAIRSLKQMLFSRPVVVFGVMKDKEYQTMIDSITKFARHVIAVQPKTERALSSKELTEKFHAKQFPTYNGGTVVNGLSLAQSFVRPNEAIVIFGSHYVVGEAFEALHIQT